MQEILQNNKKIEGSANTINANTNSNTKHLSKPNRHYSTINLYGITF